MNKIGSVRKDHDGIYVFMDLHALTRQERIDFYPKELWLFKAKDDDQRRPWAGHWVEEKYAVPFLEKKLSPEEVIAMKKSIDEYRNQDPS